MEKTADEIIDEYCKETNFKIGASRSAVRRFVEWQIKKAAQQSVQPTVLTHCPEGHGLLLFGFCDICKTQYSHSG